MIRFLALIVAFSLLANCDSFQYQKTVELDQGKKVLVSVENRVTDSGETILVVDYASEESPLKEKKVEKDVLAIWNQVRSEADEREIVEAVINYRYRTRDESGTKRYEGILFTADKKETGDWSVRKVE